MQILFQVSALKCLFVYKRTSQINAEDELDKKLIEVAARLSTLFSTEPFEITTNINVGNYDSVPVNFQTCKTINLIFRCFDTAIEGNYSREKTIPISLCFDTIINKEFVDKLIKDQYINLEPNICGLLDTLIKD